MGVVYVLIGEECTEGYFDFGFLISVDGDRLFALDFADGFVEEFHVHFEADGLDVTRLLGAEEIAAPTNFQIVGGRY